MRKMGVGRVDSRGGSPGRAFSRGGVSGAKLGHVQEEMVVLASEQGGL